MSDESFNWIDEQLRRVPLPAGLLQRLRRIQDSSAQTPDAKGSRDNRPGGAFLSDGMMDALLRDVDLPPHLLSELTATVDNEAFDERLREVPLPSGLLDEIAAIPQDERLRDVPIPAELLVELRRIPAHRIPARGIPARGIPARGKRGIPTSQLALAASLLLMITMGYVLSMAGLMMTAYDRIPEPYAEFTVQRPAVELTTGISADEAVAFEFPERAAPQPTEPRVPSYAPASGQVDSRPIPAVLAAEFPGYDMSDNLALLRYGILGQPYTAEDRAPDLEVVSGLEPRGIEPPIALGFDRQFLITERTHPVVSFADIKQLVEGSQQKKLLDAIGHTRLPLWTRTESFDRLRQVAQTGRLPPPRDVRVEDFLAAMDFQYAAAPPGELAIRAAAGPSVFGKDYARLMQVGVQAGTLPHSERPRTHITLVIDISDSMRWEDRMGSVRRATGEFLRLLRAEDCVSLVVFNERAYTLLEDATGEERATLNSILDRLSPHGGTNVIAGLKAAAGAAESPAAQQCPQRRLVLISDGMPVLPPHTASGVAALLRDMKRRDVELDFVKVDRAADVSDGFGQLAALAGEELIACPNADKLHRNLCRELMGVSPVVARDATLTVSFNPKAVRAYRLLGHEATTGGGMMSAKLESTMLAGQAATALYELWLEPNGPSLVAEADVTWVDADGRRRAVRQEIHRRQFKPSWREAALPLQAAAIAAEAAEVLRESPFAASRNRDLRGVLAQADEVNPRLAERESFQRFLRILRETEQVRRGGH